MSRDGAPLVRRLQRLADRPGLVSRRPGRRLLERHERITAGLPLSALIGRHAGSVGPGAGADLPVVSATWASAQPVDGVARPAATITRAPASGPMIQRKAAASAPPSTAGIGSVTGLGSAVTAAAPGSPVGAPAPAFTPNRVAGPPVAAGAGKQAGPATPGSAGNQLIVASPDPTHALKVPSVVEQMPLVELTAPRLASLPDLGVHRPSRPGPRDPQGPPTAVASSGTVVVRATPPRRHRDDSAPRLHVVRGPLVSVPSTAPMGGEPGAPPAPVAVRAVGSPRHPGASASGGLGATRLPVVPIAVAGTRAMPPWRALPLAAQAGSSASLSAGERTIPAARAVPVAGRQASSPAGTGPGGPVLGGEPPASPMLPTPPVDVDAIAATVQRRVLRRFELEAERRGGRR